MPDRLGELPVDRSTSALAACSGDAWPRDVKLAQAGRRPPTFAGVVRPTTVEQVAEVLADAAAAGIAVVPVGLRSGICGALSPQGDEIALDLTGLDRVLEVDADSLLVSAEAGIRGSELEARLEPHGLTLGHYPQSLGISTLGGWIATRSTGLASTRYGGIEDHVRGLVVVLADGTIVTTPAWPRASLGPDLTQLFVGSEGTFGVVCAATLAVRRRPECQVREAWALPSYGAGLAALRTGIQGGVEPAVARLYNATESRRFLDREVGALLVLMHEGHRRVVAAERDALAGEIETVGGESLGAGPAERWFEHRYDATRLMAYGERPGSVADAIEVSVDWARAERLATRLEQEVGPLCSEFHLHGSHFYRQGASAYAILYLDADGPDEAVELYDRAWAATMELCLQEGAAIGHHHGVGRVRLPWLEQSLGSAAGVLGRVRSALDPAGVLSPGRLVAPAA